MSRRIALVAANSYGGQLRNASRDSLFVARELCLAGFSLFDPGGGDGIHRDLTAQQLGDPEQPNGGLLANLRSHVADPNLWSDFDVIVGYIRGHGVEQDGDLVIVDGADNATFRLKEYLQCVADLPGLKITFMDCCRFIAGRTKSLLESNLNSLIDKQIGSSNFVFLASDAGGDAFDGPEGGRSHLVRALEEGLRCGSDEERVEDFLTRVKYRVAELSGQRQQPVVLGARSAPVEYSMYPWRSKMEMPTTGEELTIWRQKTGVSVEALADRINRLPVSVRNWEQDGKTKLPPSVLKRLQHCYNSDGTPKATNEPDGMLDDFNDYDGNELEFSVRLKEKFNDLVKDPSNSVDRLVLTDVDNAIANGLSTIWLASDEGNEGRQIGDRLVRRIVLDFHKRSSDPDANKKRRFLHGDLANNSDAERHVYVCEDGDKRYACSAKAVEFDDGTNSNNFVLAISSRGAPRAGFNTEAVPMKEAAKTFLRALGRLKKG